MMHPEYSSPLCTTSTAAGSPTGGARKRRRDDPLEFVNTGATPAWAHQHPHHQIHHIPPPSSASKFALGVAAPTTSKLSRHSSRMGLNSIHNTPGSFILHNLHPHHPHHHPTNGRSSPKHKRVRPVASSPNLGGGASYSHDRPGSSSPYSNSQRMHLSPEFAPAQLPTPTPVATIVPLPSQATASLHVKQLPPQQQQRCHICKRTPMLAYSSLTVSTCEHCNKPACDICSRECASCDEKVCGKCCKEVGDYTFCGTCWCLMEKRQQKQTERLLSLGHQQL